MNVNQSPFVSVCCLTYNHEKYIRKTLDGILMQKTEFPFEILIHDDASTDRTAEIIREYQKRYPDIIKPIFEEKNQWTSYAWGVLKLFVYPKARGKYVALCEGDDYWTDAGKLQRQVDYMESHPECPAVFHAVNYVWNGQIIHNDRHFDAECNVTTNQVIYGGGEFCATSSLLFKAKYAMEFPQYRDMVPIGDYPLQVMLSTKGPMHYFPEIMGAYRTGHEESWSTSMGKAGRYSAEYLDFLQIEVNWLKEFDKETRGKYKDSVHYRIGRAALDLYVGHRVSFDELKENASQISFGRKKVKILREMYRKRILRFFRG